MGTLEIPSTHQAQLNADPNDHGIINLDTYRNDNFSLFEYKLSQVLDDVLLVQYVDIAHDATGQTVMRNGIALPLAHIQKAWRIGKVVLAGPQCNHVKVGDFICFPSDKGIPCSNIDVSDVGTLKDSIFLNESRVFGVCKPAEQNASTTSNTSKATKGQRRRNKVRKKKS